MKCCQTLPVHLLAVASMKNRALIALITVVAAVFGFIALGGLKQELTPNVQFPQLAVLTIYQGATPEVVNQDISTPIEAAIQGVPGIESTSATSSPNRSLISVTFTYGTNLLTSEQKINQAINRIKSTLPNGVEPQVLSGSFSDLPVMQVAVSADLSRSDLADVIRNRVLSDIRDVEGVRDAVLLGAPEKRINISPNQAALRAQGLTSAAIKQTLDANGILIPAGEITENDKTYAVQVGERISSVDAIKSLPITTARGPGVITIGMVSDVVLEDAPATTLSRVNGEPALSISITKLPAANTVDVSRAVTAIIPQLQNTVGNNAQLTTVFDQAPFIEKSIESLAVEGLLGLAFAVLVILVFLLSIRSTLVTAISIPTSVLITFIGLQASNYSLNILTLGALTIAIGRVVDDSIVVIENIKRHLVPGSDRATVIVDAVREVAGAVTASTATTVAVFLPLAFVGDITGELFRPFALTVTIALAASLLVSLTIVPVLAYWFLRTPKQTGRGAAAALAAQESGEEVPGPLQKAYLPVIQWTLKHSVSTMVIAILLLVGTGAIIPFMKTNFLGSSGQNTFSVTQKVKAGTSLASQDQLAQSAEQALRNIDGVEIVQTSIGSSGNALRDAFGGGSDTTITYSVTTVSGANQDAIQDAAKSELSKIAGKENINVAASAGFGVSSDISIDIQAPTAASLTESATKITEAMRELSSVKQVSNNLDATRPFVAVTVNRDAAAAAGYSEVALAGVVAQAMRPSQIGSVNLFDTTVKIYLESSNPPQTESQIAALPIATPRGFVPLSSLATVSIQDGPATVTTIKGQRTATVRVTPSTSDLGATTAQVNSALAKITLPAGATATIGGASSSQASAFQSLGIALLVAILIVYIIMVATFGSLLQPLLLLISVPFAATGAIGLQVITGIPLGVASFIGLLMLVGIVVTNAIVLVDLINQYRARGLKVFEAIIEGSSRRLRPILMTALATIFALIPLAVGITGSGGFISQPLAIVVIGGLISSTALTLIVLPVLYNIVEGGREKRRAKRAAKNQG